MNIGEKLKSARLSKEMTQEEVASCLYVSRQSISNWENNKTYPDIINVIAFSDLYEISLDELLKGSDTYMKHLEESTDIVKSNKRLILIFSMAMVLMVIIAIFTKVLPEKLALFGVFGLEIIVSGLTYIEIIKRF